MNSHANHHQPTRIDTSYLTASHTKYHLTPPSKPLKPTMDDTGYHYMIDAHVKEFDILMDADRLQEIFKNSLQGFTILNFVDHKFDVGGGVTGLFLLAESHCSYHTYPESSYIAIDIFTCGREPSGIIPRLIDSLDCEHHVIRYQQRGTRTIPTARLVDSPSLCAED